MPRPLGIECAHCGKSFSEDDERIEGRPYGCRDRAGRDNAYICRRCADKFERERGGGRIRAEKEAREKADRTLRGLLDKLDP